MVEENTEEDVVDPGEFDDTDTGRDEDKPSPWDPAKIRITTKNFTLREIIGQIADQEIDLAPDFQRDFVWKARQRTRLVESILLGIPLPAFYFNQESDGTYQVVDGVQRLSTIHEFMQNQHSLDGKDLEYLKDLSDSTFDLLDTPLSRRFRATQIVVHVIEPQTPDEVKYDIFSRVNTLGSPLSHQEIRHAMSKRRSRDFLKSLAECNEFDVATFHQYWKRVPDKKEKVRDSGRMANRELALRFCAFRHFEEAEYRKYDSLDGYLGEYTRRLDGRSIKAPQLTDDELKGLRADFRRGMTNASAILGKAAFRRWPLDKERRGPINRAVFEAQAIALAGYSFRRLGPHRDQIVQRFRGAFSDELYRRSVTVGTGDPAMVSHRLLHTQEILREILS